MPTTPTGALSIPLPDGARARGIDPAVWSTLQNSTFPGGKPESILAVLDYCKARKLDPLKKPCHIVPMEVLDARTNQRVWRDVILGGIVEARITAQRTGEYLGRSEPTWGPEIDYRGVTCHEWCALTIRRFHPKVNGPIEFPVRVYFREVVTLNREGKPNARWSRAPKQMLLKCTEAAGLREAFPDELGGEMTAEEMDGARSAEVEEIDATLDLKPLPPKPDTYDDWVQDLCSAADEGTARLRAAWKASPRPMRDYLEKTEPRATETLKNRAASADAKAPELPDIPPAADVEE